VFSNEQVLELARRFVCMKADPADRGLDRSVFAHKATRYVPEVVFLSPDEEVLGRLDTGRLDPEAAAAQLEAVLKDFARR
jgi:hypothetical protein